MKAAEIRLLSIIEAATPDQARGLVRSLLVTTLNGQTYRIDRKTHLDDRLIHIQHRPAENQVTVAALPIDTICSVEAELSVAACAAVGVEPTLTAVLAYLSEPRWRKG